MPNTPTHQSPWMDVTLPEFPALQRDIEVDVLVVGAGLTGITTACLLVQEGVRVAPGSAATASPSARSVR